MESIKADTPMTLDDWMKIGATMGHSGRFEQAEYAYQKALEMNPKEIGAMTSLAGLYRKQKLYYKSTSMTQKAIRENEMHPSVCVEAAMMELHYGDWEKSEAWFQRSINLDPNNSVAWINWGYLKQILGDWGQAAECYKRASKLNPLDFHARFNLAINRMAYGDKRAYQEYELRHLIYPPVLPQNGKEIWTGGEVPEGKRRLMVYVEQGIGDAVMTARYAQILARTWDSVAFAVRDANTLHLMSACTGVNAVLIQTDRELPSDYDYHVASMSLPGYLGHAWPGPYLNSKDNGYYAINSKKLRVGFAWKGNSDHENDYFRSMPVENLDSLYSLDMDLVPVCLQHKLTEDEGKRTESMWRPHINTPYRLAQCIDALDLVITVDTLIAHIAGAMGKSVWILLPLNGDWRWGRVGDTTPWYPSARLFRCEEPLGWETVVQRVKANLEAMIHERETGQTSTQDSR